MGSTKFTFYKVSVELANQTSLLAQGRSKNELVADAFNVNEPITFNHQGGTLAYLVHKVVGDYIVASLGKRSEAELSGPPSKGFELTTQEEWPHVLVIINTSAKQPLGQTIAIQWDNSVFREPVNQLRALVDARAAQNDKLDGYELVLASVATPDSFWDIVRSRTGRIQRLTFDLAAPNFLALNNALSASMKEIKEQFNATEATVSIGNPQGGLQIPTDSKFVQEAVEYATKGAGEIKLKVKEEGTLDAKKHRVTAQIATIDTEVIIKSDNVEQTRAICDKIFSCLEG
jgi:hypothetical protein